MQKSDSRFCMYTPNMGKRVNPLPYRGGGGGGLSPKFWMSSTICLSWPRRHRGGWRPVKNPASLKLPFRINAPHVEAGLGSSNEEAPRR